MGWFSSEEDSGDVNTQNLHNNNNVSLHHHSDNIMLILLAILCVFKFMEFIIYLYVQNNKRIYAKAEKTAATELRNRNPAAAVESRDGNPA